MASMAISLPLSHSPQRDVPITLLSSDFLPKTHSSRLLGNVRKVHGSVKNRPGLCASVSISCSSVKIVRSPSLDRHVVKQNKTRFLQKLKTLLLSKPKHFIPLHILSKCRSYLSLSTPKSVISMIRRYPTIFELFSIPWPPTPLNATKLYPQLCVRLTPAAEALAAQELRYKASISNALADKLQKLLMISSHHRLLLSKLVHLAPDLGLPPNFRSRLCNDYPDKFKTVDTSYGRALELVSWDASLAKTLPSPEPQSLGLIVDRPLKFKHLRLRKGLNLKRGHRDFLIKFRELPDVCPYTTPASELAKESIAAEKRGCAVVREVLGLTVEKRTLIDHLTHFRKDFGLPNKLRGMVVRHPDLFYVSLKGLRDSVLLLEGYDEKGRLLEKDESLEIKEKFLGLVMEGKRMKRERRRARISDTSIGGPVDNRDEDDDDDNDNEVDDLDDDYDDGFENLFESESLDSEDYGSESSELLSYRDNAEFWTADRESLLSVHDGQAPEPW